MGVSESEEASTVKTNDDDSRWVLIFGGSMIFRFKILFGIVVALSAVLGWYYPTVGGLPDDSARETKCKDVRERTDIQDKLSMLHDIDKSLVVLNARYADIKKLNANKPVDLRPVLRGIEERQHDLSNKKTKLLGDVPCLADVYNGEPH